MSGIKIMQVEEMTYDIIVIIYWYLQLKEKRRVEKSKRIGKRKERKGLAEFVAVITRRRSVLIKETERIRKAVVVIPNYQVFM